MNANTPKRRVMVVDDDADIRYAIASILRKCDCDVVEVESVETALELLQSKEFETIFCDMRFHGNLGGEDLLERTVEHYPHINVVLVSCAMDESQKTELLAKGAAWCLQKPFFRDTCVTVLAKLDQLGQQSGQRAA